MQQAPGLAREMGLPKSEEDKFRAALQALDKQSLTASEAATSAVSASPASPAATPAAGATPVKQQAVW